MNFNINKSSNNNAIVSHLAPEKKAIQKTSRILINKENINSGNHPGLVNITRVDYFL